MRFAARLILTCFATILLPAYATTPIQPEWTTPIAPFKIADNLYYVGSKDLASYLVTTPAGDILINSNLTSSPPLILASIRKLGFRPRDVKVLLICHAHFDHAAGSAEIKRLTGARYMVMDGDVATVQSGGAKDFALPDRYPPAHVDRVLHDGDTVSLGGITLTAHKTAGHTRGCTTWTMRTTLDGKPQDVVIVGGWSMLSEFRLVDAPGSKASYPGIASDFAHTFATLHSLHCDIFLGAHGGYFDMLAKLDRAKAGAGESVWIDPDGYRKALDDRQQAFETELKKQQSGVPSS